MSGQHRRGEPDPFPAPADVAAADRDAVRRTVIAWTGAALHLNRLWRLVAARPQLVLAMPTGQRGLLAARLRALAELLDPAPRGLR